MNGVLGLIYTGERDAELRELTALRDVAAIPMLARYRMIDFPLSCMVNSGIRNVGVIVQRNYHSLLDHLGAGKEWDLHGKRSGLTILPPFLTQGKVGIYTGFLDALRSNLTYLRNKKEEYVIVSAATMLHCDKFEEMVKFHEEKKADITVMYTKERDVKRSGEGKYAQVDSEGRIVKLEVGPSIPHYDGTVMETFCVQRSLLIMLCDRAISKGQHHFFRELLLDAVNDHSLSIYGYESKSKVWNIDSVQAYYQCNMELLNRDNRRDLFLTNRPIWTKLRDEMPSRYLEGASVRNSFVADGCVIEGDVENCMLFRGVRIHKGAKLRNCIVMQDGIIHENAEIEHCILDKQVTIRENVRLIGAGNHPVVVGKNMII